jgi:hypothetical protein
MAESDNILTKLQDLLVYSMKTQFTPSPGRLVSRMFLCLVIVSGWVLPVAHAATSSADSNITTVDTRGVSITSPPQSQTINAGANVTFTVTVAGVPPFSYQWYFNNSPISGATNATLTLNSVGAGNAGSYSVVVWNAYGSIASATASLKLLADPASGNQPGQLFCPAPPPSQPTHDSLVVVTHGWLPRGLSPFATPPSDVPWVAGLANKINQRLSSEGKTNWLVIPWLWIEDAWTLLPEKAAVHGYIDGWNFGVQLSARLPHWQHIHLIGHSAGAAFIESAAAAIKLNSPTTEVHTTFLDPFVGVTAIGELSYGKSAYWSDCYFAQDFTWYTTGPLLLAYNVDVSWLDPNNKPTPAYNSSDVITVTANFPSCAPWSSHEWPHDFYSNSVANVLSPCGAAYGFALSKEEQGANWVADYSNYRPGDSAPVPCRLCPTMALPSNINPLQYNPQFNFDHLNYATSSAGVNVSGNSGATLFNTLSQSSFSPNGLGVHPLGGPTPTNVPAWLSVGLTITNPVNFVQFDAAFTDTNSAQGLLTVYWDTNQIGMVDERVASTNLQTYRFALPGTVPNDVYVLGFRLDSFSNTLASVTVTNVTTGFVGVNQPITLGILLTNGTPLVQLTAATNFTYLVQSSTNLVDWTPMALLVNTNGTMQFIDSAITNPPARFYRAVMP